MIKEIDKITLANLEYYIENRMFEEAEREYAEFEKMFQPNAIDKINKIYNQAIKDLENLIK